MTPPIAVVGSRHRACASGSRIGRLALVAATVAAGLVVVAPTAGAATVVVAQSSDDAAARAAREIQAARDRANAAADALFEAQSDLEVLEDDLVGIERDVGVLEQRVERLRRDVESLVLARFASSGSQGIPLLTGSQGPKDQIQASVLTDVVSNVGNDAIDEFEALSTDLARERVVLERRRTEIEAQQVAFEQLQADAEAEVERLREIEEQRLTDEAVRLALAEQQAAQLALLAEAERQNAEAAARAQPNPAIAAAAAAGDGDVAGGAEPRTGASGGVGGGRTGTGGAGSAAAPVVDSGGGYVDAITCPMPGSAYSDTWGAPRSGGRSHEGVDMLAPMGVPIYAVVSGTVSFRQNRLGGNAASLIGDNGNRYYYAHLSSFEGQGRRVTQGDVIGYNGDTGNARGTPHLHFEIQPGRGLAVNPTPSVRAAGC